MRKVLTTLIYKVLLGILCPCDHLPSVKEVVLVCMRVCLCVGLRGAERELVCIPIIPLLTDAFSALSLSDLRHTITLELQYDHTFLI